MELSRNNPEIWPNSDKLLRLGQLTFDPATLELRDAEGHLVDLRRQSSAVLAELARRPGRTVSKDDLMQAVWGDVAVTDDSLVQCVGDIRRLLGLYGARGCLQTVPRRGYRIVPGAGETRARGTGSGRRRLVVLALAAIAIAIAIAMPLLWRLAGPPDPVSLPLVPDVPFVVVLPFTNLKDDPDQLYFSDGLTEDLTTDLSQVSGLRMISSASSFSYRDSGLAPEAIARELGASHLVTGSVRRDGRRIRINATLTETATGANLWANRFDRDIGGIFNLQDDVARAITAALAIELTETEELRFQRYQTVDPDAYELLLRGLEPLRRFTDDGISEARGYFQRAIAIDPDYARAHANLALTYGQATVFRLRGDGSSLDIALAEARRAVALDPDLPQAYFALAVVYLSARSHGAAIAAARQAVVLDRSYADGYAVLGQTLAYGGDLDAALSAVRTAKILSPRYTFAYLWVEGHILFQQRRYDEARAVLEEVVARNPAFLVGYLTLAATYGHLGAVEEAEWLTFEIEALSPAISAEAEGAAAPYRTEADREHFVEGLLLAGLPG